jgi:hypothetical protein
MHLLIELSAKGISTDLNWNVLDEGYNVIVNLPHSHH